MAPNLTITEQNTFVMRTNETKRENNNNKTYEWNFRILDVMREVARQNKIMSEPLFRRKNSLTWVRDDDCFTAKKKWIILNKWNESEIFQTDINNATNNIVILRLISNLTSCCLLWRVDDDCWFDAFYCIYFCFAWMCVCVLCANAFME